MASNSDVTRREVLSAMAREGISNQVKGTVNAGVSTAKMGVLQATGPLGAIAVGAGHTASNLRQDYKSRLAAGKMSDIAPMADEITTSLDDQTSVLSNDISDMSTNLATMSVGLMGSMSNTFQEVTAQKQLTVLDGLEKTMGFIKGTNQEQLKTAERTEKVTKRRLAIDLLSKGYNFIRTQLDKDKVTLEQESTMALKQIRDHFITGSVGTDSTVEAEGGIFSKIKNFLGTGSGEESISENLSQEIPEQTRILKEMHTNSNAALEMEKEKFAYEKKRDKINEDAQERSDSDSKNRKGVFGSIRDSFKNLGNAVGGVVNGLGNMVGVKGLGGKVGGLFKKGGGLLKNLFGKGGGGAKGLLGKVGKFGLKGLGAGLGSALVAGELVGGFMKGGARGAGEAVISKKGGFGAAGGTAMKGASVGALIGSIIPGFGTAVGAGVGGGIGAILGYLGMDKVGKVFVYLKEWFMGIWDFFKESFKPILDELKSVWTEITNAFKEIWTEIKTAIFGPITKDGKQMSKSFKEVLDKFFEILGVILKAVFQVVGFIIKLGILGLAKTLIPIIKVAVTIIKGVIKVLTVMVKIIIQLVKIALTPFRIIIAILQMLGKALLVPLKWVWDKIKGAIDWVVGFFNSLLGGAQEMMNSADPGILGNILNAITGFFDTLFGVFEWIYNFFSNINEYIDKLLDKIRNFDLASAIGGLWDSLFGGGDKKPKNANKEVKMHNPLEIRALKPGIVGIRHTPDSGSSLSNFQVAADNTNNRGNAQLMKMVAENSKSQSPLLVESVRELGNISKRQMDQQSMVINNLSNVNTNMGREIPTETENILLNLINRGDI